MTEKAWKRFQAEAKAIAGLDHQNLVRVTDSGIHEDSLPFFVMEYIEGASLAQRLAEQGPLDQNAALELLLQITEGIECAHKQGIVHRDLKPANIMLMTDNNRPLGFTVKILDFGLAKLSHTEAGDANLTATGEIFGSPIYMSPEQCSGETTDIRSDIYSLGCTVFEAVAGQPTFTGDTALAILNRKMFGEAPSVISASGGKMLSPEFEYIVSKMLQKDAKDRYQSTADVKADLELAISGQPIPGRKDPVSRQGATLADRLKNDGATAKKRPSMAVSQLALGVLGLFVLASAFFYSVTHSYEGVFILKPGWTVPPPLVDTPEAWLARIRMADADQSNLHYSNNPWNNLIASERKEEYRRIYEDSRAHLINFGSAAIPALVQDLEYASASNRLAANVLAHDGEAVVDPLVGLFVRRPQTVGGEVELICKWGPLVGEKLCKVAIGRGAERFGAIEALAKIREYKGNYGLPVDGPVLNEANRKTLLDLLKTEPAADLRLDLISALGYFKNPTPYTILTLSQIITNDTSESVRLAAVYSLCPMLDDAAPGSWVESAVPQSTEPGRAVIRQAVRSYKTSLHCRTI